MILESNTRGRLPLRLGRAVRRLRKAAGCSQVAFARRVGMHRSYIGTVERGETNISLGNLERIANGLSISVAWLLAEAERHNAIPRPHSEP